MPFSLVVLASKPKQWFSKLVTSLGHVEMFPVNEVFSYLESNLPDAILAGEPNDEMRDFFGFLHDHYDPVSRPAIILFLAEAPDEGLERLVDAVLPRHDHPLLSYQIRCAIESKLARASMQQRIQYLDDEVAAHQHSAREFELLKNVIVRNVSHELGTPLLQVKSAVSLIVEDLEEGNKLAVYAKQAVARLEAVVKSITQLAASLDDMHIAPLVVRDCIDSALRDLRRTWEHEQQISRVMVTIEAQLPPALGDPHGITSVLEQLIDNALKFSDDPVEVSAYREKGCVRISVQDYGIGIEPDLLENIFTEFYQIDPSDSRKRGGTGLGLANVRLILDRHNVTIKVESIIDVGSIFSFALPIADLDNDWQESN